MASNQPPPTGLPPLPPLPLATSSTAAQQQPPSAATAAAPSTTAPAPAPRASPFTSRQPSQPPPPATSTTAPSSASASPAPTTGGATTPAAAPPSATASTQPQSATASPAAGGGGGANAFRPLNVRDALQYLDRVKQQFSSEYEVYDEFLTIMKSFKTQAIDTPGVIDRVSTLFRGHPSLIQGFNTFLPPGYRIECFVSAPNDHGASNTITVTTPMGITTRTQDVTGVEAREFVRTQPGGATAAAAAAGTSAATPATSTAGITAARSAPATGTSTPAIAGPTATLARTLGAGGVSSLSRTISPPAPIPPFGGAAANAASTANKPTTTAGNVPFWQQPYGASASLNKPRTVDAFGRPLPAAASTSTTASSLPHRGGQHQPSASTTTSSAAETKAQQQATAEATDAADTIVSSAPATARREAGGSGPSGEPSAPGTSTAATAAATTTAAASTSTTTGGGGATGQPQIMEFNHAINYVNKIKNRFTKDPDTYKTFLEILQTYQKETRPIQEVYTQVTALFHSAPDLLDEFKAFLPDTTDPNVVAAQQGAAAAAAKQKKDLGGGVGVGGQAKAPLASGSTIGGAVQGVGQKKVEEKKKRAAPGMGERSKAKRAKTHHVDSPPVAAAQIPAPSSSKDRGESHRTATSTSHHSEQSHGGSVGLPPPPPQPPHHSSYHAPQPYGAPPPGFPGAPRMQSAYDAYLSSHRTPQLVQADEFGFFDRVKKYLDDRVTYTEFLKLLNLFTQEIIDLPTLLDQSLLFFGQSEELVQQFKELVGWDYTKDGRVEGEDWIIDNEPVYERPLVQLHLMKSYGPSYRKLPDSEIDLACSGRDALEWSVLNDEWVAFATWASEGSSAHRKNPFEEALYNSEQERHWYSFHIESNLRTIAHFEPIAARIALMNAEERLAFKMEEGLGGTAPRVYERIIRKVYGKDHGWEILQALFDNPAVAVPIVLSRLKQKDEEWKRAEKEWNKVWREVDNKNFYRALDHQGIPFKAVDKKATTTSKALTTEIDTLRREKQQKRFDLLTTPTPLRPLHQFELGMPDRDVLFDVLKLTFSFLDRDQSGFSAPERARVEAFLRLFIPLLFGVPHSDMEANLAHPDEDGDGPDGEDDDADSEAEGGGAASDADTSSMNGDGDTTSASTSATPASVSSSAHSNKKSNGVHKKGGAADLRKRLLKHAATAAARARSAASRANSPTAGGDETPQNGIILGEQMWIQLSEVKNESTPAVEEDVKMNGEESEEDPRRFNFFANSTFYCLVRIIHTLYHRLSTFKQLTAQLAAAGTHRRLSPLAVELGLSAPVPVIDEGDNPARNYYEHALDLAEKLFDNDIDQQSYEEQLRYMGGVKAYPLYTLDKLISTVIKHIHTVNSDSKCQDLVTLLEKDRAREDVTPRQQIAYRMEAEAAIGSEDPLYRIEWIPDSQALTIQLLGKDDLTLDDAYGSEAKMHASWVASYALTAATEGVGAHVKAPLLKRNRVLSAAEDPQEFDLSPGLEAKVGEDSYQLAFVANTEDYLHRRRPLPSSEEEEEETASTTASQDGGTPAPPLLPIKERRKERFDQWLATQRGEGLPKPLAVTVELPKTAFAVGAAEGQKQDEAPVATVEGEDVAMEL